MHKECTLSYKNVCTVRNACNRINYRDDPTCFVGVHWLEVPLQPEPCYVECIKRAVECIKEGGKRCCPA